MQICLVYITCQDQVQGEKIIQDLLESRLIACANIMPPHTSMYHWQGHMRKEQEVLCLCKTTMNLYPAVEKRVMELHTYEQPCIFAMPIVAGQHGFLEWIKATTANNK